MRRIIDASDPVSVLEKVTKGKIRNVSGSDLTDFEKFDRTGKGIFHSLVIEKSGNYEYPDLPREDLDRILKHEGHPHGKRVTISAEYHVVYATGEPIGPIAVRNVSMKFGNFFRSRIYFIPDFEYVGKLPEGTKIKGAS